MSDLLVEFKKMIVEKRRGELQAMLLSLPEEYALPVIFSQAVYPALNEVRQLFRDRRIGLPELILSLDLVRQTVEGLSNQSGSPERNQHVVLGVIEGDPHDMGKNIVRDVYRGYGFRVTDLGKNLSRDRFVSEVRERKPDLVGISTMMSTTVDLVGGAIDSIRKESQDVRIMVGGAFLNREMAGRLGADGYAESVATLIEETEAALGK
ncbi:MAG: cobalamin-dependent protein [Syntrophobacteraceae bacterium]|nr:cobalamin-dependent protein [Syntrophobacteraceae bacterium]